MGQFPFKTFSLFFAAAIFLIGAGAATTTTFAEPKVGELAPDFAGSGSDGKTHKLSGFRGKTVVLEWTNH